MLTKEQVQLVQQSWTTLTPQADAAAKLFYEQLFTLDPALRSLFRGDMQEQGRRLMTMIGQAVKGLEHVERLIPTLKTLGERHVAYGVEARHYQVVGAALLSTLSLGLGEQFTPEVRQAWALVYQIVADTMQAGARELVPA